MRISDWSSDVCSSDLQLRLVPLPIFRWGGIGLRRLRLFFEAIARPEHPAYDSQAQGEHARDEEQAEFYPHVAASEEGPAEAGDQVDDEIGRASCRERVCQYV